MSGFKRSSMVLLVVVVSVLLAGCAGFVGSEATDQADTTHASGDDVDVETVQKNALEAMDEVETVTFEVNQTTTNDFEHTVSMEGVVDNSAEQMRMSVDLGDGLFGEMETYLVDDVLYTQFGDTWYRMNASAMELDDGDSQIDHSRALLETGTLKLENTTTFDSHEVYVVTYDLDTEQFDSIFDDASATHGHGSPTDTEIDDVSVTQYIDAETYHVRWMNVDVTVDTRMGTISSTTAVTMRNFNEPVTIDLPPAAKNAIDLDDENADFPFDSALGEHADDWSSADEETNEQ